MSWILAILGFVIGGGVVYLLLQSQRKSDAVSVEAARAEAEEIAKEARARADPDRRADRRARV